MRRFLLYRIEDESGVSGTGLVAEGVQFTGGKCVLFWVTTYKSIGVYDNLEQLEKIHGHNGKTKVVWVDGVEQIQT